MSRRNLTPAQREKAEERRAQFRVIVKTIAEMSDEKRAELASRFLVMNPEGPTFSPRNQMLMAYQFGIGPDSL